MYNTFINICGRLNFSLKPDINSKFESTQIGLESKMNFVFIPNNFRVNSNRYIRISYLVLSVLADMARSSDRMFCLSSFNVFINFHFSEPSPVVSATVKMWALSDIFS